MEKCTLVSVTGNFLTMALIAGSSALSVKKPGLDFESEHALKIKKEHKNNHTDNNYVHQGFDACWSHYRSHFTPATSNTFVKFPILCGYFN